MPTRRATSLPLLTVVSLILAPCAWATVPDTNGPIAYVTQVGGESAIKSAFLGSEGILHDEVLLGAVGGNGEDAFDPAWSRDGRRLAFASDRSGHDQIYAVEPGCRTGLDCQARRLLSDGAVDREPSWAPPGRSARGGESLVFTSFRTGNPQIYRLTVTRGLPPTVVRLTFDHADDSEAKWSSTGKIAFVSDRSGTPQIYVTNGSGGEVRQVTQTDVANLTPAWSPDGEELSYTGQTEKEGLQIFTVQASGRKLRRITSSQPEAVSSVWSPDGKKILVNLKPDASGNFSMEVVDTAGTVISPRYFGARTDSDWGVLPAPRQAPTAGLTAIVRPVGGSTTINPGQAKTRMAPVSEEAAQVAEGLASKLTKPVEAPVNSTYDVTHGEVKLSVVSDASNGGEPSQPTAAEPARPAAGESTQPTTARVKEGRFELIQHGFEAVPTIRLLGRAHGCGRRQASTARRSARQPHIRARSKGRLNVQGKEGKGGSKSTEWEVRETCRGTLYVAYEHSLSVTDPRRKRTVLVTAGHSYLVRPGR
jgi:hypothetical protein